MKALPLGARALVGLAVATALVHAGAGRADCPPACTCEVRPWFTPRSTYVDAWTVDCNDAGLSRFPAGLPADTQVLLLQTNGIASVERSADLPANLTGLDLSQNSLASVGGLGGRRAPRLLWVYLEENRLTQLPDGCLAGLAGLQELYVNHNALAAIAPGAFRGLRSLLRLHLNANRLRAVDRRWFEALPSLEVLMIGENPIVSIGDMNFEPLANLRSLVMAGINLTEVPADALAGLGRLESLSFYDNRLRAVPRAALQRVAGLRFLDLNKNPIRRVRRGDFSNMPHLKELGLSSMPELVSIDGLAVDNLPDLRKIEATNNPRLSYVHPDAFSRLPRLESLLLNGNALSALYRGTVDALPGLREVSIHSNPIRCDCAIRWINMNETRVRVMEPEALLCAEPPELRGRRVRQVHLREVPETCLPLIAPRSLPARLDLGAGARAALHCRATAEPQPEISWITPSGQKLGPRARTARLSVHAEGTLDIRAVAPADGGVYTCMASNLVGADLKSVTVTVDGALPRGGRGGAPRVRVEDVRATWVLVSWEAGSRLLGPSVTWTAFVKAEPPRAAHRARLPSSVRAYNLTRLDPSTEYAICIDSPTLDGEAGKRCVSVTTKGAGPDGEAGGRGPSPTLAAGLAAGSLGVLGALCLLSCLSRNRLGAAGRGHARNYSQKPAFASSELYPPLIDLWEAGDERSAALEVKATAIGVPTNAS